MPKVKFRKICQKTQPELKEYLNNYLKRMYKDVVNAKGFLYAKGDVPILLVAHMDTVHKQPPSMFVVDKDKISSPQGIGGDDRCGVYMILKILNTYKCSVLFTEDEECGGIGATYFARSPYIRNTYNYIIQLDRRGSKDAVFYDCDNKEFEQFITETGDWKTAHGSFSDISVVAPEVGCAAVNFSCGYYNEHTDREYVMQNEMENNIAKVCRLIERTTENDKFEYIEAKNAYGFLEDWGNFGYGDYIDDSLYYNDYSSNIIHLFTIYYKTIDEIEATEEVFAIDPYQAIGKFLSNHPFNCYNDIEDVIDCGEDEYEM